MTKLAALAEQEERHGVDLGHDGMADDSCEEGFDDTNSSTVVGLRTKLAVQAEQEESHGVDLGHDGMADDSCESHKEVATVPGAMRALTAMRPLTATHPTAVWIMRPLTPLTADPSQRRWAWSPSGSRAASRAGRSASSSSRR